MADVFYHYARKIRPDLDSLTGQRRLGGVADVVSLFFSLPLLIIGLVWLVRVSDWESAQKHWVFLVVMAVLIVVFNRLSFYIITEPGWGLCQLAGSAGWHRVVGGSTGGRSGCHLVGCAVEPGQPGE